MFARLRRRESGVERSERISRAELYERARQLGIEGRSKMGRRELVNAIAAAENKTARSRFTIRARLSASAVVPRLGAGTSRLRALAARTGLANLPSALRTPGPFRAVILSVAALATGVLGLVVAYAVVPQESVAAQANASTLRLVTVIGPAGTTTLAVTRTKQGNTKLVPVRVLRTVTGPGGVSTLSIGVDGPTVTNTNVVTHNATQTQVVHDTQTEVVTQPVTVTDVVTQTDTVVVTETVVETVGPPGPP